MLQVTNSTRNRQLVDHGRIANTFWTRLRGLIGVKEFAAGDGLLIRPCNSVHCMWMSIPIDVLYVDEHSRVVGVNKVMKPWRIGKIYRRAKYVIELPAGTIERSGTEVGDQLEVDEGASR